MKGRVETYLGIKENERKRRDQEMGTRTETEIEIGTKTEMGTGKCYSSGEKKIRIAQ